jgi:hypothetical protein
MRTESVTMRPFYALPFELEEAFQQIGIKFASDEEFDFETSVRTSVAVHDSELALQIPETLASILRDWKHSSSYQLAVIFTDETKRRSKVVKHISVLELSRSREHVVPINSHNLSWLGRKGATLSVGLVLTEEQSEIPGLPFRLAQVAAMHHFHVNRQGPGKDFTVEFWEPSRFENELKLSGKTTVIFLGDPDSLLEERAEEAGLRVVINDRLRSVFAHSRRTKAGNNIQDVVKTEAISQLLYLAKQLPEMSEQTVGYNAVKRILSAVGKSPGELPSMRDSDVFSAAQVYCQLTDSVGKV